MKHYKHCKHYKHILQIPKHNAGSLWNITNTFFAAVFKLPRRWKFLHSELMLRIVIFLCFNFWWESLLLQSRFREVLSSSDNTHLCFCVSLCFNLCLLSKVHLVNWSFRKRWSYRSVSQFLVRVFSSKVSLAKWSLIKRWSYRSYLRLRIPHCRSF